MKFVTGLVENFVLVEKFADVCVSVAAGSKKLESFLHIFSALFINFNFLLVYNHLAYMATYAYNFN